ncbi:MAG: phosphoribosylglycinamide formyltransferase [Myxococcota bacterium]
MKRPVGVLISGSGTNLQALLDAAAQPDHPARIAVVLSNKPGAYGLERARAAGVPTEIVSHRGWPSREAYDGALVETLRAHGVEWVCLAGFMRLVTPVLLDGFGGRVLNIHPSLLPSFPGLHAQRQALEHGVKIAGATVHLVDAGMDSGPIVEQAAVPVEPGDTEDALSARILAVEHQIYPRALARAVRGELDALLTR